MSIPCDTLEIFIDFQGLKPFSTLNQGLRLAPPTLSEAGCGGTYFLKGKENDTTLAVFKPKDEEAGAPQNPRGYLGSEGSRGYLAVASASRAVREVAAFLLDRGHAKADLAGYLKCIPYHISYIYQYHISHIPYVICHFKSLRHLKSALALQVVDSLRGAPHDTGSLPAPKRLGCA